MSDRLPRYEPQSERRREQQDEMVLMLAAAWAERPELRLTQLLWNLAAGLGEAAPGFFYREDEDVLRALQGARRA